MNIIVIGLFILLNLGIIIGLYFAFLRRLSPTLGYISLAALFAALAIADVVGFEIVSKKLKKSMIEEVTPDQCTKEYVQKIFNQLAKPETTLDKEMLGELLLQCFDDRKQLILVRHSLETANTAITGQPSKIPLEKYIKSLATLNLGDSIHIDLLENNSAGLIMYLEVSEKQPYNKK
jgi:hypothetical protein